MFERHGVTASISCQVELGSLDSAAARDSALVERRTMR